MDPATRLQSHSVLGFSDETNMGEFVEFLGEHMAFTEQMIHQTICIGDVVEQAIRYNNLEAYQANCETDQKELAKLKIQQEKLKATK